MKIICRICGKEFEHPDGKRGTKPSVCKSKECQRAHQREYQARWLDGKRAGEQSDEKRCRRCGELFVPAGKGRICEKCLPKPKKMEKPKPDTSKAGWPEDTKKCVECGDFFMDDGRSRLCPICKAARKEERYRRQKAETAKPKTVRPEPIRIKPLDEVLKEAKAAGYEPEDYGKYKAAKALEKAGHVDVNLAKPEEKELEYDIYKETGFEGSFEHESGGFEHESGGFEHESGGFEHEALMAKVDETQKAIDEFMKEDEEVKCKECGFEVEPVECGNAVECPACGKLSEDPKALFDDCEPDLFCNSENETPHEYEPAYEPWPFIWAIKELMKMAEEWRMDPQKVYPLAEDILKKGILGEAIQKNKDAIRDLPGADPAWGFDRKGAL